MRSKTEIKDIAGLNPMKLAVQQHAVACMHWVQTQAPVALDWRWQRLHMRKTQQHCQICRQLADTYINKGDPEQANNANHGKPTQDDLCISFEEQKVPSLNSPACNDKKCAMAA